MTQISNRLVVHREPRTDYPELYYSVYIAPDSAAEGRLFIEMFTRGFCHRAKTPEEADLVVFGGGEDINPTIYGEPRHSSTRIDRDRDEMDILLFEECVTKGIPMFGVCRGAQLLHALNGGKLYQDVNGHGSAHTVTDTSGSTFTVSSVHHQMCVENDRMEVLAYSNGISSHRSFCPKTSEVGKIKEVEAYYYRDTGCFGVQGHPEYPGYGLFTNWCMKKMLELFDQNPDFSLVNNCRRLNQDIIDQRTGVNNLRSLVEGLS